MAKKEYSDDDGRTIADMNIDAFKWYDPSKKQGADPVARRRRSSRAERKAILKIFAQNYLVPILCVLFGFTIAFLILYALL